MRKMAVVLAVAGSIAASAARADGILRDSFGAVSSGRAGAGLAVPDRASIVAENPALMLSIPTSRMLELSTGAYSLDVDYSDPNDSDGGRFPLSLTPEMGAIHKAAGDSWAVGFLLYSPGGFSAEFDLTTPAPPIGLASYETSLVTGAALVGLSFRISEKLTIGASLGGSYARLKTDTPFSVQTGPLAGLPTLMKLDAEDFAPTGSVGLSFETGPSDRLLRIGISYIHGADFDLEGEASSQLFQIAPAPIATDFDAKIGLSLPRRVGVGLSRRFGAGTLALDVLWTDWSAAFDGIQFQLSRPTNPVLGGTGLRDELELAWKDSLTYRVGWESDLGKGNTLQLGYTFHRSPVPDSHSNPLIPAIYEHLLAVGYSRQYERWKLSLAGQVAFGRTARVRESSLVGGEFDSSKIEGSAFGIFFSTTYFWD